MAVSEQDDCVLGQATPPAAAQRGIPPTPIHPMPGEASFESFAARVRQEVSTCLAEWLEGRIVQARARGGDIAFVADAVGQLVLRGGKRLRAALVAASYEGCGGEGAREGVVLAGASIELLQGYLLVHDDWMDGDEVRRGGPSVPAMMRASWPRCADSASILAGDLACAWAQAALLEVRMPPERVLGAARELARMQEDVVSGQILDVRGACSSRADVETVHLLKTSSYTVRGPILMGARLAGATGEQLAALAAFAEPLGVAFQLRDDVMGTFGDARAMGKPSGGDLRRGKWTALVADAMGDPRTAERLRAVLGRAEVGDQALAAAVAAIEDCGARERVERRIEALCNQSRAALDQAGLTATGRVLLSRAIVTLTERSS